DKSTFYLLTNDQSAKGEVIAIDINQPSKEHWKQIIPEQTHPIISVKKINNYLITSTLNNVSGELNIYHKDGTFINTVPLPKHITIDDFASTGNTDELFISYNSFTHPTQIIKYNIKTNKITDVFKTKSCSKKDDIEVKQIFYPSKDGV